MTLGVTCDMIDFQLPVHSEVKRGSQNDLFLV